ncbi:MAG TPA: hypothetical protein VGL77_04455, partial [Armatimonadota bacterium]
MHTHQRYLLLALALVGLCFGAFLPSQALPTYQGNAIVTKGFWDYSAGEWGDGRPAPPVVKGKANDLCWKLDYQITVPKTGWYQLVFKSGNITHDLFVDGVCLYRYQGMPDRTADGWSKAANLALTAGAHTLRIQRLGRVGFPPQQFETMELRTSGNMPQNSVSAKLSGLDVVRVGERVKLVVTSGYTTTPVSYQILRQDLQHPAQAAEVVASVTFPGGQAFTTKTLDIPCPGEGVFRLQGRDANATSLGAADFHQVEYAVIDTKSFPGSPDEHKTLVHDIDCTTQMDQGKAIDSARFFECNGKTRVTDSTIGRYRESNNCTGPEVEKITNPISVPRTYSGFAYQLTLPKAGAAYLIEMDYPDNERRAIAVPVSYLKEDGTRETVSNGYSGKSIETGGMFPLSNTMLVHRFVFWAYSREINVGILSQQVGQRAAASRIRIYQFDGDLPIARDDRTKGRIFGHWFEEGENWRFLVAGDMLAKQYPQIAAEYIALNRWIQLARYTGMTTINGPAVAYQGAYFPTTTLDGYMPSSYSQIRLTALLCEKYRMTYIPEVFPGQWYRNKVDLPKLAKNPDDVKNFSAQGLKGGEATVWNDNNFMHPAVQKAWTETFAEIGDQLRDSPAFGGVSVRLDSWVWYGDWCFTSLLWGYDDYTVGLFQKETGMTVPGVANDPKRFEQRYQFLTTGDMRARWLDWRCSKVLDYHRRLRDAFSGPRKDVSLYMVGDGYMDMLRDEAGVKDTPAERFRGNGIDTKMLQNERGIALIPAARYGSRNTGVLDQQIYDGFFQQDYVALGMNRERGFGAYMMYHELGGNLP